MLLIIMVVDETENSEKNYNESKPVDTTKSTAYIDKKAIQIMVSAYTLSCKLIRTIINSFRQKWDIRVA